MIERLLHRMLNPLSGVKIKMKGLKCHEGSEMLMYHVIPDGAPDQFHNHNSKLRTTLILFIIMRGVANHTAPDVAGHLVLVNG